MLINFSTSQTAAATINDDHMTRIGTLGVLAGGIMALLVLIL